ncbi:LysR substrate-binding domain-containing protein [Spiribacter halobius]|nr:LysR substrate-binding domain-containing protein [Spiribacter halobius]UEX79592.1 LysR family transcriptional regulator [Spiribacter halobius]
MALRVFETAARRGSFQAAAEELGVSPSAVSHQIRTLEDQLDIALFVRRTRRVELTEAGARLASAASRAFGELERALEELREAERTLTVSTTPAFGALWLAPRIRDFEAAHGDIRVHIDSSVSVVDFARERRMDLAVRYGRGPYPGLDAETLARERLAAYGTPGYLAGLADPSRATYIDTRWQGAGSPPVTWQHWFAQAGELPPAGARLRSFTEEQHVINAGLAGQGLILISDVLVSDIVRRGWLVPYRPEVTVDGLAYTVVVPPQRAHSRRVRLFRSWLLAQEA